MSGLGEFRVAVRDPPAIRVAALQGLVTTSLEIKELVGPYN